jgi:hypothetical protein
MTKLERWNLAARGNYFETNKISFIKLIFIKISLRKAKKWSKKVKKALLS